MDDNKPCDDIFDGLAELLITNGKILENTYKRSRDYSGAIPVIHTHEFWRVEYNNRYYTMMAIDSIVTNICRYEIDESEGE